MKARLSRKCAASRESRKSLFNKSTIKSDDKQEDQDEQQQQRDFPVFPNVITHFQAAGITTTPSGYKRLSEWEKIGQITGAIALVIEDKCGTPTADGFKKVAPCLTCLWPLTTYIIKLYVWVFQLAYFIFTWLPKNVALMIYGVSMCFYGGRYLTIFAAIEAFRSLGWKAFLENLQFIWEQITLVAIASAKDDDTDENKDGIADVDQLDPKSLMERKIQVFFVAIKEPQKLQAAVGYLISGYMAMLVSLKVQFARAISIALGIAEMTGPLMAVILGPLFNLLLGTNAKHWSPTFVDTAVKAFATWAAWYFYSFIGGYYTAQRGGRMFANALADFYNDSVVPVLQKCIKCFCCSCCPCRTCCIEKAERASMDVSKTYLDEFVAYSLMGLGFSYQLYYFLKTFPPGEWLGLPFPFSYIFMPLDWFEWALRFQLTWLTTTESASNFNG
mmetsp:Transcript_67061/g.111499  ORF Transcript_67061/g.111499 Transcript_67061/m.111499 type:complete len:445 (+) Transcript_67061:109-1443(+)|eukprot:CAMPEP_0119334088 /NCGR_PEP_ID=MMETSP1333-20130426/86624_1 /TAXON_ID=418940 /ORGANISM="Scyphosphaera apsteinii, Strain RCC1455" /LENGTH=444 /DNA_ID=CAMNT_0007344313 /DNA_START=87 /DNA_END=1421 /DNA_ORIENTATION=-